MKVAKLPDGGTFKFSDDAPDEIIDHAVRLHTEGQKKKVKEGEEKEQKKHDEILQGLQVVAHLIHQLLEHTKAGHEAIGGILKEHTEALKKPRKMKAVRDSGGKITGSEEV